MEPAGSDRLRTYRQGTIRVKGWKEQDPEEVAKKP